MSIPSFPTLFISAVDRSNFKTTKTANSTSLVFRTSFTSAFHVVSNSIKKEGNIAFLTFTATKYGGDVLLNTTVPVGTIPPGFRPSATISGTFPYILNIGDIGAVTINADGTISIRSGDTAYIADTSTITVSIMYIT